MFQWDTHDRMPFLAGCCFLVFGWMPGISAAPPDHDYVLLFEDEFDGPAVNESHWGYRVGRRTGGTINGLNRKENVSVSDGMLRIAARQETIDGQLENTGGGLISKHQFGYGYYETLSKPFMKGRGVHTSFWQAGGRVPNNRIFEIDSYEIDSTHKMGCNNLYVHISPQGLDEVPWPCRANVPFDFRPDGWFLDGYEYTPEGVIFYDNGNVVAHAEWEHLTAAQCVWLTALNGTGRVEGDKQPGESLFEYFRYYAKDYPGGNLLPNGNFEYNQDKVDPHRPVSWQLDGAPGTVRVVKGGAARDQYKLRCQNADEACEATIRQQLEYILNGPYELSAMVRSSGGQETAQICVSDFGGAVQTVDLPACEEWTRVAIPAVEVAHHSITIAIHFKASAGQWLEVDDIQFSKPLLPGHKPLPAGPFVLISDPIWKIAEKHPIQFAGDEKFYFFGRNVGFGDAITVSFTMKPGKMAAMSPIARIPKTGQSGWAVYLMDTGGILFRIGSSQEHRDVVVSNVYQARKKCHVACVFDRGTARIHVNGKLVKTEGGISQQTRDATAPGRLGYVGETYLSVGDVLVRSDSPAGDASIRSLKAEKFSGILQAVRVYNRALDESEIAELNRP